MLRCSLTALVALTLTLPRVAPSQPGASSLSGDLVVRPSQIQASAIAVPPFAAAPGSSSLDPRSLSGVIDRNLEIAGWFRPVEQDDLVAAQDRRDRQRGETDFAEWARLGADYLVRGTYTLASDRIDFEVQIFDVSIGRRLRGIQSDPERPMTDPRDVAHLIADEIVRHVTGEMGIARSRILFIAQRGPARELAMMDADGGRARLLTEDGATVMSACWGANNTEVYFTSTVDFNPDLLGMFTDGSRRWFISRLPGLNLSPAWSPRARRIALTISRDGNSEIYTVDRDGSNPLRLTYNRGIDSSPWWTPNGRELLFTSDRDGSRPQIWAMGADGRGQRRLTARRGYRYNDGASVSPDGRRVVFTASVDGQFDIFVMSVGGDDSSWVRLTDSPADDEDPTWTWDGQHVVFSSTRAGSRQIHIMNADGSNVHRLTNRGRNLSPMAEPPLR